MRFIPVFDRPLIAGREVRRIAEQAWGVDDFGQTSGVEHTEFGAMVIVVAESKPGVIDLRIHADGGGA